MAKTMPTAPVVTAGAVSPYLKQQASTSRQLAEQKALSLEKEAATTGRTAMQTSAQRDVANIQAMAQRDVAQTRAGTAAMQAGAEQQMQAKEIEDREAQRVWQEEVNEEDRAERTGQTELFLELMNRFDEDNKEWHRKDAKKEEQQRNYMAMKNTRSGLVSMGMLKHTTTNATQTAKAQATWTRVQKKEQARRDQQRAHMSVVSERLTIVPLEPPTTAQKVVGRFKIPPGENPTYRVHNRLFEVQYQDNLSHFGLVDKGISTKSFDQGNIQETDKAIGEGTIRVGDLMNVYGLLKQTKDHNLRKAEEADKGSDEAEAYLYYARLAGEKLVSIDQMQYSDTSVEATKREGRFEDPLAPTLEGEEMTVGTLVKHVIGLNNGAGGASLWDEWIAEGQSNLDMMINSAERKYSAMNVPIDVLKQTVQFGDMSPYYRTRYLRELKIQEEEQRRLLMTQEEF